jgi:hypothetical protein
MSKPAGIKAVARSKHARVCVYADPGVGKTRLIGTSPGRVLLISPPTDHADSLLPADRDRVERWTIDTWDDMAEALEYLRTDGGNDFDWVWLDSLSLMYDHLMDDIWETVVREKPARARYGLDKAEYGINMFRIGGWLRHVVGPDTFNFGFTAHTAQLLPSEDEEESKKLMPWVQGKNMSPKCCGYMNVVAFMEVTKVGGKDNRRVLRTNSTERYYAKDQFDFTDGGRMVDPTMPKIVKAIEAARGVPLGVAKKAATSTKRRPVRRAK